MDSGIANNTGIKNPAGADLMLGWKVPLSTHNEATDWSDGSYA